MGVGTRFRRDEKTIFIKAYKRQENVESCGRQHPKETLHIEKV